MKKVFFDFAKKIRDNNKWLRNSFIWKILIPYWLKFKHKIYEQPKSRDFFRNNANRINYVANLLADEESKKTYLSMIDFRCSGKKKFPYHGEENQYFINNFFKYGKDEVLIDCGAFTGDTIDMFLALPNIEYKQIIAFEPDNVNYKTLSQKYSSNQKIKILNAGAFLNDGKIKFSSTGDCVSCIDENGELSITTRSIDSVCKDSENPITLIKMDIEGAELPALKGAENTILKDKPKLAICIYHSDDDMISIAEYIHAIAPEYKLYVRQHDKNLPISTILYANP